MPSSGILHRVALVRTDVSEERYGYVPSSPVLVTLIMESLRFSETSVLTRATRRNIPEDTIFHSHHRENLKSYKLLVKFVKIMCSLDLHSGRHYY
jgi:hypothetical protein